MRIQVRMLLFTVVLLFSVVAVITINLFWFERRQLRAASWERADAVINSVGHMAREAIRAGDDLMLLSYLKNRVKVYPEIELAVVRRKGHTSVIGQLQSKLYYRSILITGPEDEVMKISGNMQALNIPAGALGVQMGFSEAALESRVKVGQRALLLRISLIALPGLLLGLAGFWWISRRISRPIEALARRMRSFAGENPEDGVPAHGNEVHYLERQYETMAAKIQESAQFKEDLLLTLTHELNNPLAGLKGILWTLQSPKACDDPAAVSADCRIMSDAVNVMELSLSNTIQLFKLSASPELKRERLAVNDIFDRVIQLLRPAAQAKSLILEEKIPPAPVYLYADPELLRRIVINLVSNACKYTPSGGNVRVELGESGGNVNIVVSDTGPGIAPEDRDAIFTKFYRVPSPDGRHRRIPGSGLGLAITKRAVEQHNGRIWVESAEGGGSVFYVVLPQEK